MKKRNSLLITALLISLLLCTTAQAKTTGPELQLVRCTCYIATGNVTASGVYPYEGIVASTGEHLANGDIAALYTRDMEFIGYFECRDTGGDERIQDGTRIDIYRDSIEQAYEWVGEYGDFVYVEWVEAKG